MIPRPTCLRFLAVVWCSAGLIGAAAGQQGTSGGISWNAGRPLVWQDFQGPVDPNAPANTVATTAASLNWTYSYELARGNGRCSYRITEIVTGAVFHPRESWVRPEHRTASVLEHEQGHFDLTQVHKEMLDRAVRELVGTDRRCSDRGASLSQIEAAVAETLGPIRDRVWRNLQLIQEQYDVETRHGILVQVQQEWSDRIREALRRGQWE